MVPLRQGSPWPQQLCLLAGLGGTEPTDAGEAQVRVCNELCADLAAEVASARPGEGLAHPPEVWGLRATSAKVPVSWSLLLVSSAQSDPHTIACGEPSEQQPPLRGAWSFTALSCLL